MDSNKAHITLILDRSASMESVKSDVIGAVNKFIADQKAVPNPCTFTLVQFDSVNPYEVVQNAVPISDARPLGPETYVPRGNTPLLDCIGRGIVSLGETLKAMPDADRPGKVIFVVQTDGQENASSEYTKARIAEMVKHQTDVYKWQFVFLGANIDAIGTGTSLGFSASNSSNYAHTGKGTGAAMRAVSCNAANFRQGLSADMSYSAQQRDEAMSK